jgi:AbrB family looped-hinge helix DNA binding protein
MTLQTTTKIGKRGSLIVPNLIRQATNLKDDDTVIVSVDDDGRIIITPAMTLPLEVYSLERKAEFLLSNATDEDDYKEAILEVKKMGLDPKKIKHYRP